jgi:signal transduction histidine kinase
MLQARKTGAIRPGIEGGALMAERAEARRDPGGAPGEEQERIRRNLTVFHWAALVGVLLGALSDLTTGATTSAGILMAGAGMVVLSMWLRRRGRLQLSAVAFLIFMVTAIHALCAVGEGLQDTATILYPVAILCAALMLDRGLLVAVTVACIASVTLLVVQSPGRMDWPALFDVSLILIVTAVAVYLLLRDVVGAAAEARTKERRLAQAYRELEARNAELERFTYVVSHDLKSPLVTIRGFLDYVEQDARAGDTERLENDIERIRVASDRMGRLLDELLELSRTGRIERPLEALPFGELVREARALVEGRLTSRGVRLEVAEAAAARVVHGDRGRLVELLQNLLDNAAKFSGGQPQPRVVIGVRDDPDGEGAVFSVSDNGRGIDPAHQEGVFELFKQLDPREEGTGLGLALGRRIVETHGGRLWVESEGAGRGSTFCFTLPPAAAAG